MPFEAGLLLENLANRLSVGDQGVPSKSQAVDRPLSRFVVASATGVRNEHWNVTEVSPMARCWFNTYFGCYADDDKGVDTTIAQSEIEPRPFERRHCQFVEYAFSLSRR